MSRRRIAILARGLALVLSCAGIGLSACADEPLPSAAPDAPRDKQRPRPPIGKPTAPIAVSYELSAAPELGQPLSVRIEARAAADVGDVSLDLSGDAALHVGVVTPAGGALAPGEHAWIVVVTPVQETVGHLNVSVTGRLDGEPQTRSLQIPIRVGARSAAASSTAASSTAVTRDAAGEAVISLPAEERRETR